MIIERRLKYINFRWDDDTQELEISTYGKNTDSLAPTGLIRLNKTYLFSTIRFMTRINQRTSRGFPAWVKRRNQLKLFGRKKK